MTLLEISLAKGWATFWGTIQKNANGLTTILAVVGTILVVFAIGKWLWDRRKGGGGNSSALIWTAIVGAALAGPEVLFPIILRFVDWIINLGVGIFQPK